ncbi:extracellular solute-binding protein [Rhizobium ruizarguesonis]|jgi:ABC-type glycerol-3-phosphate transport system substrate-binding protein|uniref:Extracellular solute-binding protein n=3 Tax=Rhizobium/Agrobacterium group TaxID=227290 RepID=A0AAE8Q3W1_9HYPH|nr:extracellular solute-binding protein [Rhizobium ruizarguesonis]TBY46801.1 extracellular solute-binding protein [Rhizobium leguminosarum bv. viciae]TCA55167.1 extracellular solute-binding protein [Rhizobium pisi]TAU17278.1 extracellular solute-binding protein [Rhizobium ruizarguesonis]TAU59959.1 extracellular solute-binding protein [Rhizobium ruizarguesonis]
MVEAYMTIVKNHREMSRRTALKAAAALLAAYNLRSTRALAAGESLNILNMNLLFGETLGNQISKSYTAAEISADPVPQNEHYEKLLVEMSQGSSTYDLLTLDALFINQVLGNQWVKAVEDIQAEDASLQPLQYQNVIPESLKFVQRDGKHYGIPLTLATPIFVYRKDLFEAKGLSVPTNWDDYRKCAEALHTNEVAGNILLLGGQDAHMSGDWATRLMSMTKLGPTDDGVLDGSNQPAFNTEGQGVKAIERIKEVLPFAPKGAEGLDYPDGLSLFSQGKAAMFISWSDVFSGLENGPLKGKFGYAAVPSEKYQQQMTGGFSIGVSAFSQKSIESYKFLDWMLKGEGYKLFLDNGEMNLVFKSQLEDPAVQARIPSLAVYQDFKKRGTTTIALPPYRVPNSVEVQRVLYEEILAAVLGRKSPDLAMKDAETRVKAIIR